MRQTRWIECAAALVVASTGCSSGPGDATGAASAAAKTVMDAGKIFPDAGMVLDAGPPGMDAGGIMTEDAGSGGACQSIPLGDDKACSTWGFLKVEAENVCLALGERVTNLEAVVPCTNGAYSATVECCGVMPPPPPPMCVDETLGDGKTCLDPSSVKQDAVDLCSKLGLDLESLGFTGTSMMCPAGTQAQIVCCPPPPPPKCIDQTLGDGKTCLDQSTLKEQAAAICMKLGEPVTSIQLEGDDGGCATTALVECCSN